MEGWTKLLTPCFTGGELDIGKEYKGELGVINNDAVGVHVSDFGTEELDVGNDFLLEVEAEGKNGCELLKDIARVGPVCTLDGCVDKVVELIVIDAPVVGSVGVAKDSVGDVKDNFVGDGFRCPFFSSDDRLIDHVDAVSFVLGIGARGDGGEHWKLGCGVHLQ